MTDFHAAGEFFGWYVSIAQMLTRYSPFYTGCHTCINRTQQNDPHHGVLENKSTIRLTLVNVCTLVLFLSLVASRATSTAWHFDKHITSCVCRRWPRCVDPLNTPASICTHVYCVTDHVALFIYTYICRYRYSYSYVVSLLTSYVLLCGNSLKHTHRQRKKSTTISQRLWCCNKVIETFRHPEMLLNTRVKLASKTVWLLCGYK